MSGTKDTIRRCPRGRLRPRALPEIRASRLGGFPYQLQLGRQREGMQVIPLDDRPPSLLSETAIRLRVGQRVNYRICDRRGIEEIHQQSVFTVTQDFLDRRSPGADYETSRRERLEHGPGEDERVGEIHVNARDL